jgi:hypothetical protein
MERDPFSITSRSNLYCKTLQKIVKNQITKHFLILTRNFRPEVYNYGEKMSSKIGPSYSLQMFGNFINSRSKLSQLRLEVSFFSFELNLKPGRFFRAFFGSPSILLASNNQQNWLKDHSIPTEKVDLF